MGLEYLAAVVIFVSLVAFSGAYAYEYNKARRHFRTKGTPISHSAIFKNALTFGLILGVACCIAEAKANNNQDLEANNSGGGDGGGGGGMPMVQQPTPAAMPPMNSGMDWTPIASGAADPVQ